MEIQEELNQFERSRVWTLVPPPSGNNITRTKWIFRNKMDENEVVIRNKERLVSLRYRQQEGIQYDQTFAHVAILEAIMIFFAYATYRDFKLYKMDLNSDFLNEKLSEEVYV
ncbi:retrovirus-related pol polyprotein from transposon TNT 1-94 [Tanacetum coccineum]